MAYPMGPGQREGPRKDENTKDAEGDAHDDTKKHSESIAVFKAGLKRFQYATTGHVHESSPAKRSRQSSSLIKHPPVSNDASDVSSPPKKKKGRKSSGYAPPSTYAHLPPLLDILAHDLICIFVGTNPGVRTATAGHTYAHPSNMFWKLLHSSGCTEVRLRPEQDGELPRWYAMGNTNLVSRPTKNAGELSRQEMTEGTPILEAKVSQYRPEAVCIVGKGIWEAIWRWRHQRDMRKDEFRWGWQSDDEKLGRTADWEGAKVFVATSTSGLSASLKPTEKEAIWKPFGEWVMARRNLRFGTEGRLNGNGYQPGKNTV